MLWKRTWDDEGGGAFFNLRFHFAPKPFQVENCSAKTAQLHDFKPVSWKQLCKNRTATRLYWTRKLKTALQPHSYTTLLNPWDKNLSKNRTATRLFWTRKLKTALQKRHSYTTLLKNCSEIAQLHDFTGPVRWKLLFKNGTATRLVKNLPRRYVASTRQNPPCKSRLCCKIRPAAIDTILKIIRYRPSQ